MRRVALAVFDLDNTLYDWYAAFVPAFYSMVRTAAELLSCKEEILLDELKAVHVKHHDVEHPFSLFETTTVKALAARVGADAAWQLLDPAFHTYNKVRKAQLRLFPGVTESLTELRARDIVLVAYTDSRYFAALGRVHRLGLAPYFAAVYCREKADAATPNRQWDDYGVLVRKVKQLPAGEFKPNPKVLIDIASSQHCDVSEMAYVGDSVSKDVLMAKRAGCFAIWAKYGAHTDPEMYRRLVRISHWTEVDIQREQEYAKLALEIVPDFVCERTVAEVLHVLDGPACQRAFKGT